MFPLVICRIVLLTSLCLSACQYQRLEMGKQEILTWKEWLKLNILFFLR